MNTEANPTVTLSPSGRSFTSHPHSTLLESGLSAGIALPYRCSNGTCGDCRAIVKSGHTEPVRFHDYVLSDSEKLNHTVLLCSSRALNDLEIEVIEASHPQDIPVQQLNTKLCHREVTANTLIVRLRIIRGKVLRFLAGQYAKITIPRCEPLLLPIASCPCETGYLELHLPMHLSDHCRTLESLRRSDKIAIEGPYGAFAIQDSTLYKGHHIFIAEGSGFAAIKPLLEHVIATELEPQCTFYRVDAEPYKNNLCRSWADAFDWFTYHTVPDVDTLLLALNEKQCTPPATYYVSARNKHLTNCLRETTKSTVIIDELAFAKQSKS